MTPPARHGPAPEPGGRNLLTRIAAALVLIPLAVALAYVGGWPWLILVILAAIGLYLEWLLVMGAKPRSAAGAAGAAALIAAGISLQLGRLDAAAAIIALGLVAATLLSRRRRGWAALGFGYAAAAMSGSVLVRLDQSWGFAALMLILLVVWMTDSGGYFAGRSIGGPKLWPRVSPKKTWAGAIGGFVASLAVAAGFAAVGIGPWLPLLALGAMLSTVSQLGDLFESGVKRIFGVKDSSQIIPGHGGLLDRLDGYVAAVVLASILGLLRGGFDGVGRGLMVW